MIPVIDISLFSLGVVGYLAVCYVVFVLDGGL